MKRFTLFLLLALCLCACKQPYDAQIAKLDVVIAFEDYDYYQHHVALEYILKVNENMEYSPSINELQDTIKEQAEEFVSESFDSLYIKYGDAFVKEMIYKRNGIILENKEELHKYFVNSAVAYILNRVSQALIIRATIIPNEEELRREIEKYSTIVFKKR